jgi:hypothetical protein
MKINEDFMRGWLVGFFDGEGTIFHRGAGRGKKSVATHISATNTDKELIKTCSTYLNHFGIYHIISPRKRLQNPTWKPIETIMIYRGEDVLKFHKHIGFISPNKVEKLLKAIDWINRPKTKYDIAEIKRLYWEEGLSYRSIGERIGIKGRTGVKTLFDRWQIPRRDRLVALKNHYK